MREGTGSFSAFLDDVTNTFYVQPNRLDAVVEKCGHLQLYWGTSAHLFESVAPWKEVKRVKSGQEGVAANIKDCSDLQKK